MLRCHGTPVAAVHASAKRLAHGSFAVTPGRSGCTSVKVATKASITPSRRGSARIAGYGGVRIAAPTTRPDSAATQKKASG